MLGKDKCKLLKQLRKRIADENGIEYHIEECKFKGECKGTCPKCDAELLELTKKVEAKKRAGMVGLGVGAVALSLVGCTNLDTKPDPGMIAGGMEYNGPKLEEVEESTTTELEGPIEGKLEVKESEDSETCVVELEGDVVYKEETDENDKEEDFGEDILEGDIEVDIDDTDSELKDIDEVKEYPGEPLAGSIEYKPDSIFDSILGD